MNWLRRMMYGRYGLDNLGNFLFGFYLITFLISFFLPLVRILSLISGFLMIYRMLSKKYYQRRAENDLYLRKTQPIRKFFRIQKNKFQYRKTHKYFKCPSCHQYLRVPRHRGEITITCPHCRYQFDKKT